MVMADNNPDEGAMALEEELSSETEVQVEEPDIQTVIAQHFARLEASIQGKIDVQSRWVKSQLDTTANSIVALETKLGEVHTNAELATELAAAGYDKEQVDDIKAKVKERRRVEALEKQATDTQPGPAELQQYWDGYYFETTEPDIREAFHEEGLISTSDPALMTAEDKATFRSLLPNLTEASIRGYAQFKRDAVKKGKEEADRRNTASKKQVATRNDRPTGGGNTPNSEAVWAAYGRGERDFSDPAVRAAGKALGAID